MSYRHILIMKSFKVGLKNNSLSIFKNSEDDDELLIPLEDISSILFEDFRTVITSRLISECSKYGITLFFCDETYMPNTQVLPLNLYYSKLEIYNKQISCSDHLKELIWQKIVKRKIHNQEIVVRYTSNDEYVVGMLNNYSNSVKLNDLDNREGIASKIYFVSLFGDDFIRFNDTNISNALDYGYTIFHGMLSRILTLYGFTTFLGIWHNSSKNAFNLSSDFIEVFRPIVDYFCFWRMNEIQKPLSTKNRIDLIDLVNKEVSINGMYCKVDYAMEQMVKSYIRVLDSKNPDELLLPEVIGMSFLNEEFV